MADSLMENSNNNLLRKRNLLPKMAEWMKKKWGLYVNMRFREQLGVSVPFLADLNKDWKITLGITIEYEDKTWDFDFYINSRGHGLSRKKFTPEENSEFVQAICSGQGRITVDINFGEIEQTNETGLKFPLPPNQISILVRKLLEEQVPRDVRLVAQNGEMFPCHKAILAGHCEWFHHLFQKRPEKNIWKFDMTEEGLSAFLKYVYYADTEEPKKNLKIGMELLKIGHKYEITLLEKLMMDLILEVPTSEFTWEIALELFCFTRNENGLTALRKKAIERMKLNSNSVNASESETLQSIVDSEDMDAEVPDSH
ncbi:unnamed protein product [Orchesella dallaii]|uniref:BTB domain-containing protein n=1 Tax=Orchesella dallaii TaxID=48710 RepID=A0ABP1RY54_9HEXA